MPTSVTRVVISVSERIINCSVMMLCAQLLVGQDRGADGEATLGVDAAEKLLRTLWGEAELHAVGGGADQGAVD